MSMFENDQYRWRGTYFVLFRAKKRPKLEAIEQALDHLSDRFVLANLVADEKGFFESLTLLAPDDFAALDICYLGGEEVREQGEQLVQEITAAGTEAVDPTVLQRIREADGRFDILHFEQAAALEEEEEEEMFDPSALLVALEALVELTDGIAVDPQAGTVL